MASLSCGDSTVEEEITTQKQLTNASKIVSDGSQGAMVERNYSIPFLVWIAFSVAEWCLTLTELCLCSVTLF